MFPPEARLAEFVSALSFDALSAADRDRLGLLLLDTVAVAAGAVDAPAVRAAECLAASPGPAPLIGLGRCTDASAAAFVNAAAAEVLDFQEVLVDGRNNGHAAVVVVPALLAVAAETGASGADVVAALAGALAVNRAVLRALGRAHREAGRGVRTTALGAPIAAAAAATRLAGGDAARVEAALNLAAGALPAGLLASMAPENGAYSADKDLAVGWSAQHAVQAARLALAGADACRTALTGHRGLFATFGHGDAAPLESPDPGDLGIDAYAMKRFPSNFGTQAAIAAALALRPVLAGEPVAAAEVSVKTSSAHSLSARILPTPLAARFSLPYCVAAALADGTVDMASFAPDRLGRPAVRAMMERVTVVADAALEERHRREGVFPARLVVTTRAGRRFEAAADGPWDGLAVAAVADAIVAKARGLLDAWPEARAAALVDALTRLDRHRSVADLSGLLAGPGAG